jgi:hypothetical protein
MTQHLPTRPIPGGDAVFGRADRTVLKPAECYFRAHHANVTTRSLDCRSRCWRTIYRETSVTFGPGESEPPRDVQKRSPDGPTLEATLLVDGLAGAQHAVIVGRVDGHVENGSYPGDQKVVADEDDGLDDLLVAVVRADVGEVPVVDL